MLNKVWITCLFLAGVMVGEEVTNYLIPIERRFSAMSAEDQADFIEGMMTPYQRRAIAEEWCKVNRKTERVCRGSR